MHLTENWREKTVMARIMRRGKLHQQNFSLKQHGSWKAARKAAQEWVKDKLEILPTSVMNAMDRMTSRNHSGVVGVHLARHNFRKPNGREYIYWRWVARWPGCPLKGGVSWSVLTLGDDDAFALAVLSREKEESNRKKVFSTLARIYGTTRHEKIMALKSQEPDIV